MSREKCEKFRMQKYGFKKERHFFSAKMVFENWRVPSSWVTFLDNPIFKSFYLCDRFNVFILKNGKKDIIV